MVHNRPKLTTARCAGHCRAWGASMPGFHETPCAPQVATVHHRPSPINQRGHVVRPPCPSFASSVTGQGRHATSPLSVHQVHGHGPPAPLPCAALGRYTLPLLPHQPSSVHQRLAREGVGQVDAARHCGTVRTRKPPQAPVCSPASTTEPLSGSQRPQAHHRTLRQALPRRGRVNARLTQKAPCPTSNGLPAQPPHRATRTRFARPPGHQATDFVRRSAFSKAGSHDQRFACVSQSAGALSPKDTPRFASC